jgi:hypothetical protein
MEPNETALRRRARRSYELARLRRSWRATWLIAPMALVVHPACGTPALTIGAAVLLAIACAALTWRGEAWAKAVYPGLSAGFFAAVVPMIAKLSGLCGESELCAMACVLGGVAAGAIVAIRARALEGDRRSFIVAASVLATIGGAMGCALAGLGGLAGMTAGLLLPTAPALLLQRS